MFKKLMAGLLEAIFIVFLLLIIQGCSSNIVKEDKIKEDILCNEKVANIFSSRFFDEYELSISKFDVEKRQINSESKNDIIYCNTEINNNYYLINLSLKLVYNYYDEGGWILDNVEILKKDKTVTSGPSAKKICELFFKENDTEKEYKISEISGGCQLSHEDFPNCEAFKKDNEDLQDSVYMIKISDSTFDEENSIFKVNVLMYNEVFKLDGFIPVKYYEDCEDWSFYYRESEYRIESPSSKWSEYYKSETGTIQVTKVSVNEEALLGTYSFYDEKKGKKLVLEKIEGFTEYDDIKIKAKLYNYNTQKEFGETCKLDIFDLKMRCVDTIYIYRPDRNQFIEETRGGKIYTYAKE